MAIFNKTESSFDEFDSHVLAMDDHIHQYGFSSFTITEDSSDHYSVSIFSTSLPDENCTDFPDPADYSVSHLNMADSSFESFPSQQLSIDEEDRWSPSSLMESNDTSMDITPLDLPTEGMELDSQLSSTHLVKAYGEAMDGDQRELTDVIVQRINEKASPVGGVMDCLLYYLFGPLDKHSDYLKQESLKNFLAAFEAFYQIFPYGMFAHFAANRSILEAIPSDVGVIHIIDFHMGIGIQWCTMIEALGYQQREIRLTSIRWAEEDSSWRFEDTKRWLCEHARSFSLNLIVDNMEVHDCASEIKRRKQNTGRREWLAFNCMQGLPHTGRVRNTRDVTEFLRVAKELLAYAANFYYDNEGIIIFGNGDAWVNSNSASSFSLFLDKLLWTMPTHLSEARTALECLFVAPLVSSHAWIRKWEKLNYCELQLGFGLKGRPVSKDSLMEAKEMVREEESPYGVWIEGDNNNDMVLAWRGVPLVRVSRWTS
ncbi:hypothetical protein NMG60_11000141 [Bertholletia excelsa]